MSKKLPNKDNRTKGELTAETKGICTTCIYAQKCSYVGTLKVPKMFCEEYEYEKQPILKTTNGRYLSLASDSLSREAEEINRAREMGLCVNCAHREKCSFPRPEGGIWHCEEYA